MNPPPKHGAALLVARIKHDRNRLSGAAGDCTVFERARVIDGDRSTVNTHVWVRADGYTAGLALNEEGTTWVRDGDDEAMKAMIALRALAGLPGIRNGVT